MEKPLIKTKVLLEKVPGKGGWTYAILPVTIRDPKTAFGWRKVRGFIDDEEIRKFNLMRLSNGKLFMPVNSSIRKKIGKEAGDWVKVVLYPDDTPEKIPEEFILCLKDEPNAWKHFQQFTESDRKKYMDWIYAATSEDKKVERMANAVNKIARGERMGAMKR